MNGKEIKNGIKKVYERGVSALKRVWCWIKRGVFGTKKEFTQESERIESPAKLLREAFFRKKGAVVALILLIGLFLFVFISPSFVSLDVNYTDPLQQNAEPGYSLRSAPKKLRKDTKVINGFADFTVGVSGEGELFIWGNTKDKLSGKDLKKIPDKVKKEKVAFASAGKDHIIALTQSGNIVGWGDDSCGQYGTKPTLNALPMPQTLLEGVDIEEVSSLSCGYQVSALVKKTGEGFVWGNLNAVRNLSDFVGMDNLQKILFTNAVAVGLTTEGKLTTGKEWRFSTAYGSKSGWINNAETLLQEKRFTDFASNNKCIAMTAEDGELFVAGAFENGEENLPRLQEGEYFLYLDGGTRHFVGITNFGNAYGWGHNDYGQCDLKRNCGQDGRVFAGSLQSYLVQGKKLTQSVGLKGYLMGTDGRGRDVFARIAHGGKMTMTIGGVAVLVSSLIATVVGCFSGYFGGWVDILLMRITEIFSSIPFLPFAMLLSQIIKNYSVSEEMRIFIIMLILGALSWTGLARMIRGQILVEREKEFVLSARAIGVKESKIAFFQVLPNIASVILVSMTLNFASCLLTESSLSYLGFGVQQPQPTWGNMLTGCNNSTVIQNYWWQWLFPALFLSVAVVCINILGDGIRDALDPKDGS